MATADYDFTLDRASIIETALIKVGAIGIGKTPSGNQVKQAARQLGMILRKLQNRHRFSYTLSFETVNLAASDADYNLSTDPLLINVEAAWYRDSSGLDRPLKRISYEDYLNIEDKDESGEPTKFAVKFGATNELFVHPVPDATVAAQDVYVMGVAALTDLDDQTDNANFQERFLWALVYKLAADLADDYAISLAERKYYEGKAEEGFRELIVSDHDRSDDDFVEPGI